MLLRSSILPMRLVFEALANRPVTDIRNREALQGNP